MADASKKRKQTSDSAPQSKRIRLPQMSARIIPAVSTRNAYPNGEVNVKNFLKSHENEIKSLEGAMRAAKKGLSRRAFQDVPRELRRRTASHNPNRVPKRLRRRARQEAREDNTPITRGTSGSGIGKGKKKHLRKEGIEKSKQVWKQREQKTTEKERTEHTKKELDTRATSSRTAPKFRPKFPSLATPITPPSRFRRRQRDKTWLPTHIWHTKRARMTDPKDPLWRFAIPLAPVVKAYRLTHRAAAQRGAVAWDMSYMSTIGLEGVEDSIMGLLRGLHFGAEETEDPGQGRGRAKKWKQGTRVWEGWLHEREAKPLKRMAHVAVIWCAPEVDSKRRKAFLRVHPSAFLQCWNEIVRISKVQKPVVMVEDLRFEIGSIEIMGPAAAETLCSILHPAPCDVAPDAPGALWSSLASVTDPGVLPAGALFSFDISDPRLRDPPTPSSLGQDSSVLIETLATWPIDSTQTSSSIFSRTARLTGQRTLPSQKSINKRQSANTLGGYPEPRSTDPQIPMLTFVSRGSKSWTVLLPWKCVMPVWRGIMRYPVSTGGNPRFGGLKERRQVTFERSVPSFPYDCPGTDAGVSWESKQQEVRKHEWTKRPKGKRIEWSTIDLGNGRRGESGNPWACEWARLQTDTQAEPAASEDESGKSTTPTTPFRQLSSTQAHRLLEGSATESEVPYVFTVKITVAGRGYPVDCSRVYRLPTNNPELRSKWLSLASGSTLKSNGVPRRQQTRSGDDVPQHLQRRELASRLLQPPLPKNDIPTPADEEYPLVPDETDLIGFVTTGNYNLAEGMPTAVANLALHRVLRGEGVQGKDRVCIVREPGRTIGRLARWEVV
ncbi:ribonuclease-like protein P complex subunit Pop1 [Boeremia exigua]|uniref:ribonuclease-like protein P complex subunit Pop1 n=1 Tax=Boeremia exigua TaxID=749465 RepID=UPI001E8E4D36|nr:ribonuclease-like protein P complex subunit Pop1 [Boeremia exigua]KAH6618703.1 ribonuclease-like protein P complex subunit Pop1 [Boeremia exigua]